MVSINGTEIGTTQLNAVPYAINAGNVQWYTIGKHIENRNAGNVKVKNSLEADGTIKLTLGSIVNEVSVDGTLSGNSDKAIPTEQVVKAYVDVNGSSGLEKITEEGSTGWRLKGTDPNNYVTTGGDAIDLSSIVSGVSYSTFGATGINSIAMGIETKASGYNVLCKRTRLVNFIGY
ncbi:hypothetical protein EGM88_04760 [Aureibaculum marinum]|uniref:Uncharacterized protein n=1 Tax=Aureibaculum marinum TaxID=2487930 RepID=A0A3N4P0G3_9FLAO|nr:hypothetical protein [Aureibaculum marinum]RPD98516.1 hypothetical protein EGM88_04760 [Aureibaculum marinum]